MDTEFGSTIFKQFSDTSDRAVGDMLKTLAITPVGKDSMNATQVEGMTSMILDNATRFLSVQPPTAEASRAMAQAVIGAVVLTKLYSEGYGDAQNDQITRVSTTMVLALQAVDTVRKAFPNMDAIGELAKFATEFHYHNGGNSFGNVSPKWTLRRFGPATPLRSR